MAERKWIDDLRPAMSIAEAARLALRARLEAVRDALPPAVHEAARDPEHVHRLRVSTRRADAALRIFQCTLSGKSFKRARRRLRRIRKAAGAARDWDVFFFDLQSRRAERPAADHASVDFLVGYAFGLRSAAQPELEDAGRKNRSRLESFIEATVAEVTGGDGGATLIDLARPLLSNLLHRLAETASGDLSDFAQLHQVRIAGKRLRYAMEVFGYCFTPEFRESIYPQVEEMQEILGNANDSHVAVERMTALRDRLRQSSNSEWKRTRPAFDAVLRHHKTRLTQERRRFLAWWKRWKKNGAIRLGELIHANVSGETA
jgi:CHAD domain-containing protein